MRQKLFLNLILTLIVGVFSITVVSAGPPQPETSYATRHDTSPPLRSMLPILSEAGPAVREIPRLPLPRQARPEAPPELVEGRSRRDPVLQNRPGAPNAMPSPIQNFEGVGNVNGVLPPDTQGDVGPNHYVQWVNLSFAIWDKSGNLLYGPANGNTLWTGFDGPCETTNDGDPITLYDHLADRWLMSQFALPYYPNGPFYQCIAISATPDPTGAWHRYQFEASATKMNDYPKFGVWPDGYYMTVNQFNQGSLSWGGAGVFAFERERMLLGQSAQMVYFDLYSVNSMFGGMLPSDLDGFTLPPAGAPNYFVEVDDGSPDAMRLWEFHVDWTTPSNSTFGLSGQPNAVLPVASFTPLCPTTRNCIPQPGTSQKLDAIGDRLMYRLAYRNMGTHESLVVNHTVNAGSNRAGVRWYEVRDPGALPFIYQQSTYAPADGLHRWMGSIAMDGVGNIAVGYSASSASVYPSIRYTGRLASDPMGTMPQGEGEIIAGSGSQTHSAARWGDYSMMGIDPVDDCTFWYTQEYIQTTGSAPWRTRIGSFKFPDCASGVLGTLAGTVYDSSTLAPIVGAQVQATSSPTQTFETGSGAGGEYALTLTSGTYTVTASAYGYLSNRISGVSIDGNATTTLDIPLTPAPIVVVSGTVTDAVAGWPLYARIDVGGYGGGAVWNDPVTGFYSVTLAGEAPYDFTVEAWVDGYLPSVRSVGPLAVDTTVNLTVTVDAGACSAPGYVMAGECSPLPGGLVVGNVYDDYSGDSLDGATVVDDGGHSATATATIDPAVDEAFYTLFSPSGTHTLTATQVHYGPKAVTTTVIQSDTVRQDLYLPAARLSHDPAGLAVTLTWGTSTTVPLTLTNAGDVLANFELVELDIPWLNATPVTGTVSPSSTQLISVTFDAGVLDIPDWGTHYARLEIEHDTPYSLTYVPLTMTVNPPPPTLAISKTPSSDPAGVGLPLHYTVTISNAAGPATGVTISDTLPANTLLTSASHGGVLVGNDVVWSGLSVPGVATLSVSYTVTVGCVSSGTSIVNNAYQVTATEWLTPVRGLPVTVTAVTNDAVADFGFPTPVLRNHPVLFTNLSQNSTTYEWDFGDGVTSTLPYPTHIYTELQAYTVTLTASHLCTSGDSISQSLSVQDYAGIIDPAVATGQADPGQAVTYTLRLTNTGTLTDAFDLSLGGHLWDTTLSTDTVGPLAPGESESFEAFVAVAPKALSGDWDRVTVTGAPASDPRTFPAFAVTVLTTTANTVYDVALEPSADGQGGIPGAFVSYTLQVVNTGNISDTYTLSHLSGDWLTGLLPPNVFTLEANDRQEIQVQVTIPFTATVDERNVTRIQVTAGSGVTTTGVLTTTVECTALNGASFSYIPTLPTAGDWVTFTGGVWIGTPPITYTWDFDDGSPLLTRGGGLGSGEVFTHIYAFEDTYRVVMTATNCSGAGISNAAHLITIVGEPGVADIAVQPLSLIAILSPSDIITTSLAISNVGAADLLWSLSLMPTADWLTVAETNGTVEAQNSTAVAVTFTAPSSATVAVYTTTLHISSNDPDQPDVTVAVTLTLDTGCDRVEGADFSHTLVTPGMGAVVVFTGTATSGTARLPITYTWDFGDSIPPTPEIGNPITHTFPSADVYTVTLTVANACPSQDVVEKAIVIQAGFDIYLPVVIRNF